MEKVNYNHLYYFNLIAAEGSIASAARKVDLSSSTLSEQLRQLEESFGSQLFERDGSRLKLSEAGRRMQRFTRIMFQTGERLIQSFDPKRITSKLTLDLGVSSSVSKAFASRYIDALVGDGSVLVRVREADFDYLVKDLHSFEVDLMLSEQRPDEAHSAGLISLVVHECPLLIVAGADFPDLIDTYSRPGKSFRFLHCSSRSDARWPVDQFFEREGIEPDIVGEVDDLSLMHAAVLRGVAIAALPQSFLEKDIETQRVRVLATVMTGASKVYLSYHERLPTEHVRRAIEILSRRPLAESPR